MVTGLVFSKDRPMQLDATLRSFFLHCKDSNNVNLNVLYKASPDFISEYTVLSLTYPEVKFLEEEDFREDVLSIIQYANYLLFLVDDCIFTNDFSLYQITNCLNLHPDVLGFSLRLSPYSEYCYMLGAPQKIPIFECLDDEVRKYNWVESELDFGYPLEVSSSVYRGEDIYQILSNSPFKNPNVLEVVLDAHKHFYSTIMPNLFCFSLPVAFCAPINIVQESWENKSGTNSTNDPITLNNRFKRGLRIDIRKFSGYVPVSVHQEVELDFHYCFQHKHNFSSLVVEKNIKNFKYPMTSIIIPNYNRVDVLKECLESIPRNTYTPYEVIVIDNGSTDGSVEYLESLDWINLIKNTENIGVPRARNQGLAKANGEYIVSMDNDVITTPGWLDTFINYASKLSPQAALFGPRTNFISGPQMVNSVDYKSVEELDQFSLEWRKKAEGKLHFILRLVGFCLFMRRKLLDHIGGFDTSFGLFGFEDDDFSFRSRLKGFENIVVNEVFVHHVAGPHCRREDKDHPLYLKRVIQAENKFREKWGLGENKGDIKKILSQPFDKSKHYVDIKDFLWQR